MLQLVSRHVIEIQEIGFKQFCTELQRVVGLYQILAGNVIMRLSMFTCLELTELSMPFLSSGGVHGYS